MARYVPHDEVAGLVQQLWDHLVRVCDHMADGDDDPEDMEKFADILRKFPVDVEEPESIWTD